MKKFTALIICALALLNCASSEVFTRNDIDYTKYKRIAVFPLADYPLNPGSGLQVADILSMQLINSNYNIIDRSQTMLILQEQKLGMTGVIDEQTAPSLGKLLGVQAILTGSINEYESTTPIKVSQGDAGLQVHGSSVGLALKLIDCETGQIVWAGSAKGSQIGQKNEYAAAQKAVKDIVEKLKSLNINESDETEDTISSDKTETLFPNLRKNYPQYDKFTDEQIIEAFRNKNPQHKDKSDVWIIKYLENKSLK